MRRSLQMHITLTSGLSTVCNIDITAPPTIARAVVTPESPHHDKIALFTTTTETSYHSNTATTPKWRHRPSPLGLQQYPLSTSCWRSYSYKPSPTGTTAMGHSSSTLALSAMEKSPSQMKVGSVFFDGERYADACVMERDSWGGQSIMAWRAIGINRKAGPVIFQNIAPGRYESNRALVGRNPKKTQWSATQADHCSRSEWSFSQDMGRDSNGLYQPPYSLHVQEMCVWTTLMGDTRGIDS